MGALTDLIAACDSLASDARYAKKTRTLATTLKGWAVTTRTLRQIGPLPVTFESAGLTSSTGAVLEGGDISEGSVVLAAWLETSAAWEFPGASSVQILAAPVDNPGDYEVVTQYDADPILYPQGDAAIAQESNSAIVAGGVRWITRPLVPSNLALVALANAPTAGTGNVYALIATP